MATIRPFMAIRPAEAYAKDVAALPYDVMNSEEAREMVQGKPWSFLHVDKAEVDLPKDIDVYSPAVYAKAKENLENMIHNGILGQDLLPNLYLYRMTMNGRSQTGLVCCTSVDEYINGTIKKHELTRADKEADRIRHVDTLSAQTGPIFLAYRDRADLQALIKKGKEEKPLYDFTAEDGITHRVYRIADEGMQEEIARIFKEMDSLYIADGHHRAASAVKVGLKRRAEHPDYTGEEEFNYFLSVVFPDSELMIMDYNRVVKDLNGLTPEAFLSAVEKCFTVEEKGTEPVKPAEKGEVGMYLDGKGYLLTVKEEYQSDDPVKGLDVSLLQDYLLSPILGIGDPKTDKRIDFVGGIRGLKELKKRTESDCRVAFSMYPTSIGELFSVADAGLLMPPKSTWFEPKLRSGLFIHTF